MTEYSVTTGVKGSSRITIRNYITEASAQAAAKRWTDSNSTGSYWAVIKPINQAR